MANQSTGKVIAICSLQGGVSKQGKEWHSQTFVIETDGEYPKKQAFELFGNDRINALLPKEGEVVCVTFDIESNQCNDGRWFTRARAWKVESPTAAAAPAAQPMPTPQVAPSAPAAMQVPLADGTTMTLPF